MQNYAFLTPSAGVRQTGQCLRAGYGGFVALLGIVYENCPIKQSSIKRIGFFEKFILLK